jgi:hypothetical protein
LGIQSEEIKSVYLDEIKRASFVPKAKTGMPLIELHPSSS